MNSITIAKLSLAISISLLSTEIVQPQNPPNDFNVVATAGGLMPGSEIRSIKIQSSGTTTYTRYKSNDPTSDPLEYQQFTLTSEQLSQIWKAIQENGFFSLAETYINPKVKDGTYALLSVTVYSTTYTVWTQNIAVEPFDNIINKIRSVIPANCNLIYNISEIPVIEQIDVCDQNGSKSNYYYYSKPSKKNPEPIVRIEPKSIKSKTGTTFAHPGTFVSNEMSIQSAVWGGYANVSSKGGYWGDVASISAHNNKPFEAPAVKVKIFLEFYGPGRSYENAQTIEDAIENMWNNMTSADGKQFDVDVITRVADSETPPGTPGYHQIKLQSNVPISYVSGFKTDFDLNTGVGGGTWSTTGDGLNEMYGHEAGHLMGLDDHYDDYRKQPDGNWQRLSDNQIFNSSDLADLIWSKYDMTKADFKTYLDNQGKDGRVTPPKLNHESDIMGTLKGTPLQSDIDQIASQTGLMINIQPGEILINKYSYDQNLTITRSEYLFLKKGESKQLNGLYGACIDFHKSSPSYGYAFDVGPNLAYWSNIEAAGYLSQLLNYINENDLYCSDNFFSQHMIWRITDNSYYSSVDTSIQKAGINIGNRHLDFPKIDYPYSYSDTSYYIIPHDLYTIGLQVSPGLIVQQPQIITVDAKILVLNRDDIVSDFNWKLEKPAGSTSQLSSLTGNNVNFSPDIQGIYKLGVEASFTDLMNQATVLADSQLIVYADEYTETFESGNLNSSPPFVWITTDPEKWEITNAVAHTGTYSLGSGEIENNGKSEISLDIATSKNDSIFFVYKVSSEQSYDYLRFYIDGNLISKWSGEIDWCIARFPIQQGNHTLKWAYEKDEDYSEGSDKSWIDDIILPHSTITDIKKNLTINNYKVIAYPNPVEKYLTLKYSIESKQKITVSLYDINGKLIRLLKDENNEVGTQIETFNLEGISVGPYIIKVQNNVNNFGSNILIIKE